MTKIGGSSRDGSSRYGSSSSDSDDPKRSTSRSAHGPTEKPQKNIYIRIFFSLLSLIISIIVIFRLIFHQSNPQFTLQDATIHTFNLNMQNGLLTSQMQVTFSSRNPNGRFGLTYDSLKIYASYKSEQITYYTNIPSIYQGSKVANVWSPYISGIEIPIAPFLGEELLKDEDDGIIFLNVMIVGRIKYKFIGSLSIGSYHLSVNCPAYLNFAHGNSSTSEVGAVGAGQAAIKFQQMSTCEVNT